MKVIAFDIATSMGVAIGVASGRPQAQTVDLGKSLSQGERFSRALRATRYFANEHKPDLIAIEAPITGKASPSATTLILIGARANVLGEATRMGIRTVEYPVQTIRKHFLGKHLTTNSFPGMRKAAAKREIKRCVINRCRSLGWKVADDNQADACALWDYACAMHSADHQMTTVGVLLCR